MENRPGIYGHATHAARCGFYATLTPTGAADPSLVQSAKPGSMYHLFRGHCAHIRTLWHVPSGYVPSLAGLLEDQFEGARNEAAVCLGTLMKIVGERPLNSIMDQLADVRKVKVKEAYVIAALQDLYATQS